MWQYIRLFYGVFLLRVEPQGIPASNVLMVISICCLMLSGFLAGSPLYGWQENIAKVALGTAILFFFVLFVLSTKGHRERFVQTITALSAVQVFLSLLAWPLIFQASPVLESVNSTPNPVLIVFMLALLSYSIIVVAYVFKHALSTDILNAAIISSVFHAINFFLISLFFPQPTI